MSHTNVKEIDMRKSLAVVAAVSCVTLSFAPAAPSAHAASATMSDAEVLGIYIQVNGFDVETALLARAQASSNDVRTLANHVSADHMGVRQAAFDLAAKCNVSPVLPASRVAAALEHGKAMTKLAALTGAEFDKAYLLREVAFHRSAIDAVRNALLPSATCAAIKTHFNTVLPAFEHHLSETETLARQFGAH